MISPTYNFRSYTCYFTTNCHVFVGKRKPIDDQNDTIYDACAGPHTGGETAASYLAASRQTEDETALYVLENTYPGSVETIVGGSGVTGINGQPYQPSGLITSHVHASRAAATLTKLVGPPPESPIITTRHIGWAHIDTWVADVLGAGWSVLYKSVTVSEGRAHAFWHLSGADSNLPSIRVNVTADSAIMEDGTFDVERSVAAARTRAAEILLTTERDPDAIWTPGFPGEYGDYSYQYKSEVDGGRIVVVAANTTVDISGDVSTAALEPTPRQLLQRVVQRGTTILEPLTLRGGRTVSVDRPHEGGMRGLEPRSSPHDHENRVVVGGRMTLEFEVNGEVSVAGASSPGGRVLLDTWTIEKSESQTKVRFVLVPRESGRSTVSLHIADNTTMVSTTHVETIDVE